MRRAGLALVAALAATACSFPEKTLIVEGDPYACFGKPPPTVASSTVKISGVVVNPVTGDTPDATAVEGFLAGVPTPLFTATTNTEGLFSQSQGTAGVPRNAYLKVAPNGYVPTYYYPAAAISQDIDIKLQVLTPADVATVSTLMEVPIDTTMGNFVVVVADCNGNFIPGAVVTTVPAGTVRYFVNFTPSPTAVATDSTVGAAFVMNVPLSNTTINATVDGMTLRSHTIDSVAGAFMLTEIRP